MARVLELLRSKKGGLLIAPVACATVAFQAYTRSEISDADACSRCRCPQAGQLLTSAHVRQLERNGFVVLEQEHAVLRGKTLASARAEIMTYFAAGRFSRSPNGKTAAGSDIRNDLVCWLRETDGTPSAPDARDRRLRPLGESVLHCVRLLRGLAYELESLGYRGSYNHRVPKQLQLGWYPGDGGSGYLRHLDWCESSWSEIGLLEWFFARDYRERVLTAILYLNEPDWRPRQADMGGDGGALRCYHSGSDGRAPAPDAAAQACGYTDIVPRGGTLIIFDSRRIEHEVLPGIQDRFALTCWVVGDYGPKAQTTAVE